MANESDGIARVEVTLSEPSSEEVSVAFRTTVPSNQSNPATSGVDYIDRSGTIVFSPGATLRTRTMTVIDDDLVEANEIFTFELSRPVNAEIGAGSESRQVVILNDDPVVDNNVLPTLNVAQTFASENDERAVVEITLSEPSSEEVRVAFRTFVPSNQNNPAISGVDYIDRSGTIVFPPGVTRRTRTMTLIDDDNAEPNEVFRFELSSPVNVQIADDGSALQRVFILNDD